MLAGDGRTLDVPLPVLGAAAIAVEVDDPAGVPAALDRPVSLEVGDPAADDRPGALDREDLRVDVELLALDAAGQPARCDRVGTAERPRQAAPRLPERPEVVDGVRAEQVCDRRMVRGPPCGIVRGEPA